MSKCHGIMEVRVRIAVLGLISDLLRPVWVQNGQMADLLDLKNELGVVGGCQVQVTRAL